MLWAYANLCVILSRIVTTNGIGLDRMVDFMFFVLSASCIPLQRMIELHLSFPERIRAAHLAWQQERQQYALEQSVPPNPEDGTGRKV
jgi:hypothetical protein